MVWYRLWRFVGINYIVTGVKREMDDGKRTWALPWHYALNTGGNKSPLRINSAVLLKLSVWLDMILSEETDATFKAFLLTGKTYVEGTSASVGSTQVEPAVEVMLIKAI